MWVPKGTPKEIVAKLNAAIVETLADDTVKKRLTDIGQEIWPVAQQTPGGARRAAAGRDRALVAGGEGRGDQERVNVDAPIASSPG